MLVIEKEYCGSLISLFQAKACKKRQRKGGNWKVFRKGEDGKCQLKIGDESCCMSDIRTLEISFFCPLLWQLMTMSLTRYSWVHFCQLIIKLFSWFMWKLFYPPLESDRRVLQKKRERKGEGHFQLEGVAPSYLTHFQLQSSSLGWARKLAESISDFGCTLTFEV